MTDNAPPTYSRNQIRDAFAKWIERATAGEWENLPEAQDADVSADYLVELMNEREDA